MGEGGTVCEHPVDSLRMAGLGRRQCGYNSRSGDSTSSSYWDNHVELDGFRVPFGDGSLRLMDPKHSEHTGSYTCVFSIPYTTHTERTEVTIKNPAGEATNAVCRRAKTFKRTVLLVDCRSGDCAAGSRAGGLAGLPCTFRAGSDVVIHWIQVTGNTPVHSYYHNQDQLAFQGQNFSGRTSLFKDQISTGNAALQLTDVQVQDQGRYKCYTSTVTGNMESFINLQVEAPVRKVDIQQVENRITCSSDGIYPEPILTWSTSPPSNLTVLNIPTVQNQQQLYNIKSSLMHSDSISDLVYSCTISSGRKKRTATLFQQTTIIGSHTETTIPCTSSNTPLTGLVWRFNSQIDSQIILNQTRAGVPYKVSKEWRQQVKGVSESGSLTLQDLSSNHEGIYTCELSDAEETYVTILKTIKDPSADARMQETTYIVVGVVIVILVVIGGLAALFIYKKTNWCKKRGAQRATDQTETKQWITRVKSTKRQMRRPSSLRIEG